MAAGAWTLVLHPWRQAGWQESVPVIQDGTLVLPTVLGIALLTEREFQATCALFPFCGVFGAHKALGVGMLWCWCQEQAAPVAGGREPWQCWWCQGEP